jgi:thioredoxin-like negative regulator of GroEL
MTDMPIFVIDVDEADPGVVDLWKVQSVPTLYRIKSGESVTRLKSRTAEKLLEEINA